MLLLQPSGAGVPGEVSEGRLLADTARTQGPQVLKEMLMSTSVCNPCQRWAFVQYRNDPCLI